MGLWEVGGDFHDEAIPFDILIIVSRFYSKEFEKEYSKYQSQFRWELWNIWKVVKEKLEGDICGDKGLFI